jgi:homogentisate 1,2-dioxygenase
MTTLARNADGDQLSVHPPRRGLAVLRLWPSEYEAGDYIVLPRGTMWRLSPSEPTLVLMVEATNTHYTLPDKGLVGPHAVFDPAMFDVPAMDDAFKAQQADEDHEWKVLRSRSAARSPPSPIP